MKKQPKLFNALQIGDFFTIADGTEILEKISGTEGLYTNGNGVQKITPFILCFRVEQPYDVTGNVIAFESGELDDEEVIELFQHLIDSGLAWELQGSYGRTAKHLIDAGYCHV